MIKPISKRESKPPKRESKPTKSEKPNGELIFGINPIMELLKARKRKLISIYTTKPQPKGWDDIQKLMPKHPVPIQYVARDVLHRIAGTTDHQNILAWAQPYGFRKKPFEAEKQPFLIMLDGIQDPRNAGAIIRSAYCAGANGVILCKKNAAPLSGSAIKAAAGLVEHIEIYQAASAESAVLELKNAGYHIYLATFDGVNAAKAELKKPLCLVIGSEGSGITKSILKSGTHITIPQRSPDVSYNASVAAGILLYIVNSSNS